MPISPKYKKILAAMIKQYGTEKGTSVFYATMKKKGIDYTKENSDPNILENQELKWTEKLVIKEKDTKKGRVRIGGTALKETTSSNDKKYTVEEIEKNKDKEMRYFVEHIHDKGAIGKLKLTFDEENKILLHDGWIKNTHTHPDIVENVTDGLYDVSIGGNGTLIREGDKFRVKDLDIREVSLVGIGGVKGAGIDYAIIESFKANKIKPDKLIKEVNKMVEEDKNKKITEKLEKENKELKEKMETMKKKEAVVEKAKKEELVESVLKLNKELKKEDLMEKADSELMLIKEYETKLKEKDGEEGAEGEGEVELGEKEKTEEGIVIDKRTGDITMNEKLYNKFSKEIKESIYR